MKSIVRLLFYKIMEQKKENLPANKISVLALRTLGIPRITTSSLDFFFGFLFKGVSLCGGLRCPAGEVPLSKLDFL